MDEKTQKETDGKESQSSETQTPIQGTDDAKDGNATKDKDTSKTPSMIDGALMAAGEMKKENDRKEALLDREEKLAAHKALGGTTEAGQSPAVKKETDEEYAERFRKGEASLKDNAE